LILGAVDFDAEPLPAHRAVGAVDVPVGALAVRHQLPLSAISRDVLVDSSTERPPVDVVLPPISRSLVTVGRVHACATLDGRVLCWGANNYGQLGDGTDVPRTTASVGPALMGVRQLSAGQDFTCALLMDASAVCWGRNHRGQLGSGPVSDRRGPTRVVGLPPTRAIAAGSNFVCALLLDATVQCWGDNISARLGDGSIVEQRPTPGPVAGLSGVRAIASGERHSCAVTGDGGVWCWGQNGNGELGDGTTVDPPRAVRITGVSRATGVTVGRGTSFAWTVGGET